VSFKVCTQLWRAFFIFHISIRIIRQPDWRGFTVVRYKKILIKSHFMRKVWSNANTKKKTGKNPVCIIPMRAGVWIMWDLHEHMPCIIRDMHRSRDSSVGIATGYELDDQGSEFESW
jgi:hypothetical protein